MTATATVNSTANSTPKFLWMDGRLVPWAEASVHPSRLGCTDASAHGTSRPSIHRNFGVPLLVKLLGKLAVIGL